MPEAASGLTPADPMSEAAIFVHPKDVAYHPFLGETQLPLEPENAPCALANAAIRDSLVPLLTGHAREADNRVLAGRPAHPNLRFGMPAPLKRRLALAVPRARAVDAGGR